MLSYRTNQNAEWPSLYLAHPDFICPILSKLNPHPRIHLQSGDDSDEPEIRSDVLVMATKWFASFEKRFLPSLAGTVASAEASSTAGEAAADNNDRDGGLPAPIARILSEVGVGN